MTDFKEFLNCNISNCNSFITENFLSIIYIVHKQVNLPLNCCTPNSFAISELDSYGRDIRLGRSDVVVWPASTLRPLETQPHALDFSSKFVYSSIVFRIIILLTNSVLSQYLRQSWRTQLQLKFNFKNKFYLYCF